VGLLTKRDRVAKGSGEAATQYFHFGGQPLVELSGGT
jgi:hypothetical protein